MLAKQWVKRNFAGEHHAAVPKMKTSLKGRNYATNYSGFPNEYAAPKMNTIIPGPKSKEIFDKINKFQVKIILF